MDLTARRVGGLVLVTLFSLAVLGPLLPLRDPLAQPDGLVLRDLPPLARARAIVLADGSVRWAHETRVADDAVEYRRGARWTRLEAADLAPRWERRPLFVLGTDDLGRDLLSRMIHGARVSLLAGLCAATLAVAAGIAIGGLAGLAGGMPDALLMRLTDLALSVPRLFLALTLAAIWGASLATTVAVVAATTWMGVARLTRGVFLATRENEFVRAARATGARPLRVALLHLLPAAAAPILVEWTLRVGDAILLEASMSFLGLGIPAPMPSWGNLIADGRGSLLDAWWIATLPGLAIGATVISLQTFSSSGSGRRT